MEKLEVTRYRLESEITHWLNTLDNGALLKSIEFDSHSLRMSYVRVLVFTLTHPHTLVPFLD